ncbi:hypothetical protein, partial [Trichlorobacter lovleyi]|uniref:hypothetical protein n=1 Tax=Trichlorobacter lovleyi TaxID=313985 RepID=UPI003D0F586B
EVGQFWTPMVGQISMPIDSSLYLELYPLNITAGDFVVMHCGALVRVTLLDEDNTDFAACVNVKGPRWFAGL